MTTWQILAFLDSGSALAWVLPGRRLAMGLLVALQSATERARQRQVLAALDDRVLRDIGLSRAAAEREAGKPFWR